MTDLETNLMSAMMPIANLLRVFVPIFVVVYLSTKAIREKRESGQWNIPRLLILGMFASIVWVCIWGVLGLALPTVFGWVDVYGSGMTIVNAGMAIITAFGLSFMAYVNRIKALYYAGFFFFGGMVLLWGLTGNDEILMWFTRIVGPATIAFLIITGFRLKDNGSLGIGISLAVMIIAAIWRGNVYAMASNIIGFLFLLVFALGGFKPFKQVTKQAEGPVNG